MSVGIVCFVISKNIIDIIGVELEEEIYLCIKKDEPHIPEAVLMSCFKCETDVWVSPWNLGKKLICIDCLRKLVKEKKVNLQPLVKLQDLLRAKQVLDGNNS